LDSIHEISLEFLRTLDKYNIDQSEFKEHFETLLEMNHYLLNAIGVGHIELDKLLIMAKQCGYFGKMTGAGGGGCALIYIPNLLEDNKSSNDLKEKLSKNGYSCYDVSVGVCGLSIHEYDSVNMTNIMENSPNIDWMQSPIFRSCSTDEKDLSAIN
jgi:mevalonate kinase